MRTSAFAVVPDALQAPLPVLGPLGGHLEPLGAGGAGVGGVTGVSAQVVVVPCLRIQGFRITGIQNCQGNQTYLKGGEAVIAAEARIPTARVMPCNSSVVGPVLCILI